MKKIILLMLLCLPSFGQTVLFNNRVVSLIDAPIYDSDTLQLLSGTNYYAQLFGGTTNQPESLFVPIGDAVTFRDSPLQGYINVGSSGSRTVPFASFGDLVQFQIRAWTYVSGVSNDFFSVSSVWQTNQLVKIGLSPIVITRVSLNTIDFPPPLLGLSSFGIMAIPEPSAIGLLIIPLLGWFSYLIYRNKRV